MVTLSEWIVKYAKLPLIRLVAFALAIQSLYFCYLAYTRYHNQLENFKQIKESVSFGAQQSNRPLVESAMMSALGDSGVTAVALCTGPAITIAYPPSAGNICRQSRSSLTKWEVREPLIGLQGLDLLLVLSPFSIFGTLYFLIIVALAMLTAIIRTMSRVQSRFQSEVLNPLYEGITADLPLSIVELEKLRLKNTEHIQLLRELAVSKAVSDLAAQVAHDIRSPLAALGAAAKGLELLPPEQRSLIEGSVNRMQGIADDLLQRYRAPSAAPAKAKPGVCALTGLIDQVIAEKRLQHKEKPGLKFEFSEASGEIKALVNPKELQRLISNLVNNSIEAFTGPGTVSVGLSTLDGRILIEVKDNGKGIPPEVLAKLGQKGETHGKAAGNGLGLYHARTTIEGWGGSFKIESLPGKGTAVLIELPRSVDQTGGRIAVLLDDDPLVHMNWKLAAKAAGVALQAYKIPGDFTAGIDTLSKDTPIYIDSDLGSGIKGESIATDLHAKGFTGLTMATGHGPEEFAHLPWLKVTGKEPPWGA